MRFTICFNAAGCLPDSDTYPYTTEELESSEELAQILEEELLYGANSLEGQYDPDAIAAEIWEQGYGSISYGAESTYALYVERETRPPAVTASKSEVREMFRGFGWSTTDPS